MRSSLRVADLFPPRDVQLLDAEGFSAAFRDEWSRTTERFFKLEALQEYAEPGDPSYEALKQKRFYRAVKLVQERVLKQRPMYESLHDAGAQFIRVRILRRPPTDYIKYEMLSYLASQELGEDIRIIDVERVLQLAADPIGDFLLFDSSAVLVHNYVPPDQHQEGGWLITDSKTVGRYCEIADALVATGVRLDDLELIP